ncbi:MAG: PAS domain S-box protein, partial [Gammaproteobacteria bacterium]
MTGTATNIKPDKKDESQVDSLIALIESSPAPIFIASVDTNRIIQVNQAFSRLFGYAAEEVQGMPVSVLFSEPEYRSVIWNRSGSERATQGDECLLVGKEGKTIPAVLSSHTIDLDDQVCSFTILHDISEQYRASAGLRQSEERFSLALKGAEEGVWDWDVINDSIYYSARMEEMLGYREGELDASARTILGLIHPRDVKLFLKRRRDFLHGITDRFEVEFRVRHKKGHYICILSRGFGVRDENGRICRVVGTHLDISERKRTEKLLSANERRFRALYDDSPAMFFTLDKSGKIRSVNRYGAEQLGTTVESLFGKLITEFIHDEDKELLTQELLKFTGTRNKVRRLEFRLNRQFGEPLWVRAAIRPIVYKNRKSFLMTCE